MTPHAADDVLGAGARCRCVAAAVAAAATSCCRSSPAWRSPICSIRSPTGWSGSASTALVASLVIIGAGRRSCFVIVADPDRADPAAQLGAFIEKLPGYVVAAAGADRPIRAGRGCARFGEGVADAQAVGDLVTQGAGWITTSSPRCGRAAGADLDLLARWSSRRSSRSICSTTGTGWSRRSTAGFRVQHRETVRGLAREMDDAIAGFVRGQTAVCLILGSFYAVGADAGRPQFRAADRADVRADHLHSLCRLDDRLSARGRRRDRAVLAGMDADPRRCSASSSSASSSKAMCWRRSWSAKASGCIRSG